MTTAPGVGPPPPTGSGIWHARRRLRRSTTARRSRPDVRAAAARSLGRLVAPEAATPLVRALVDGTVPRAIAFRALLDVGPGRFPCSARSSTIPIRTCARRDRAARLARRCLRRRGCDRGRRRPCRRGPGAGGGRARPARLGRWGGRADAARSTIGSTSCACTRPRALGQVGEHAAIPRLVAGPRGPLRGCSRGGGGAFPHRPRGAPRAAEEPGAGATPPRGRRPPPRMSWLHDFAIALATITLVYFATLNVVYLAFTAIAWRGREPAPPRPRPRPGRRGLLVAGHAAGVSVLVPAYNEEPTIVESVRSLLALRYPQHRGRSSSTTARATRRWSGCREAFDLVPVRKALRVLHADAPIRGVYVSRAPPAAVWSSTRRTAARPTR